MMQTTKPAPNEFAADVYAAPVYVTPGVMERFLPCEVGVVYEKHLHLDWSDMDDEDASLNLRAAMEGGSRVLSAYRIKAKKDEPCDIWIITEADRSVTTILIPEEY